MQRNFAKEGTAGNRALSEGVAELLILTEDYQKAYQREEGLSKQLSLFFVLKIRVKVIQ